MATVPREVLDRLYGEPPEGFVAARTAAAAEARSAGDPATAKAIGALRKPTVAAWLVNLLALRRPELVDELVELSTALRSAQRDLRGAQLRELSAQRREVVSALVATARELAVEADPRLSAGKLPLAEVETTLSAALADVDVAGQVRSGRLVRAAHYAGFGEVPRPQLRLVTDGTDQPPEPAAEPAGRHRKGPEPARRAGREQRAGDSARRAAESERRAERERERQERRERDRRARELRARRTAFERQFAEARDQQERAEAELDRARAAEREGAEELARVEAALLELEKRRAAAEQEAGRRKLARKSAERAAVAARRQTGEAQAALEALDAE